MGEKGSVCDEGALCENLKQSKYIGKKDTR